MEYGKLLQPVDVVIIDNLQDALQIRNGNEYGDVASAIRPLNDIIQRTGKTVIALFHEAKSRAASGVATPLGSTAYGPAANTIISCSRVGNDYFLSADPRYGTPLGKTRVEIDEGTGLAKFELAAETRGRPPSQMTAATELLNNLLSEMNQIPVSFLQAKAKVAKHIYATVKEAAKGLGLKPGKGSGDVRPMVLETERQLDRLRKLL